MVWRGRDECQVRSAKSASKVSGGVRMDEHDIDGAKAVILHLCRDGRKWFRNGNQSVAWKNTFASIGNPFNVCAGEEEVEGVFLKENGVDGVRAGEISDRSILLAPPSSNQSVVCLLGTWWNLSADCTEMTLYLHMFGPSLIAGTTTWYRGYRLELGHRRSIHDYTHVQPIKSRGWQSRVAVPFEDQGVPDTFPAFPLRGNGLTTLCVGLAIALHGSRVRHKLVHLLRGKRVQSSVGSLLN